MFLELVSLFIDNEAALIGFCFLVREYSTVSLILQKISSEGTIDSQFISSLIKVGNLLLNHSMQQLFLDMAGI